MKKSADAFRTISEVADWLGVQTHVLRFWESKFSHVKPVKRAGGRRYYRPADMRLLGGIRKLLHDDGLTIKGVQKLLREEGVPHVSNLSQPLDDLTAAQVDASLDKETDQTIAPQPDPSASDAPPDPVKASQPYENQATDDTATPEQPLMEQAAGAQSETDATASPTVEDGDVQVVDSGGLTDLRPDADQSVSTAAPLLEDFGERGSPTTTDDAEPIEMQDTQTAPEILQPEPEPEPEPENMVSEAEAEMPVDLADSDDTTPTVETVDASTPELDATADESPDVEAPVETVGTEPEIEATKPVPLVIDAPDGPAPSDITALPGLLARSATLSALSKQQHDSLAPLVVQLRSMHERVTSQDPS